MNEKVKQALEQIKGILNEELTFKEDAKKLIDPIETALNDFDRYHESQQDLIKGKDEHIAKLCNDRAELKEHEKELIVEQHRLFDLAKEQENELNKLKKFVKIIGADFYTEYRGQVLIVNGNSFPVKGKEEIDFVMEVVDKYGK